MGRWVLVYFCFSRPCSSGERRRGVGEVSVWFASTGSTPLTDSQFCLGFVFRVQWGHPPAPAVGFSAGPGLTQAVALR